MKKRKELDALVSPNKLRNGSVGVKRKVQRSNGVEFTESGSGQGLLKSCLESDSSDTVEFLAADYRHGKSKSSSTCDELCRFCVGCVPVCVLVVICASIICCGTILWMQLNMRLNMDSLRRRINSVEANNKGTPEEFHNLHTKLNNLQKNFSMIQQNITKISEDVNSINKKILELQTTTSSIKESIAAAPIIKDLPKRVQQLSQNVAAFGSQITNIEDKMEKLKKQHSDFDSKHKSFSSRLQDLYANVAKFSASPTVTNETQNNNEALKKDLKHLEHFIVNVNSSLDTKVKWLTNVVKNDQIKLSEIGNKMENIIHAGSTNCSCIGDESDSISNRTKEFVQNYINITVKQSLRVDLPDSVGSSDIGVEDLLSYVNRLCRFYIQLILQLNLNPQILQQKNNTEILVGNILSKLKAVSSQNVSGEIQELSSNLKKTNLSVDSLRDDQLKLKAEIEETVKRIDELSQYIPVTYEITSTPAPQSSFTSSQVPDETTLSNSDDSS